MNKQNNNASWSQPQAKQTSSPRVVEKDDKAEAIDIDSFKRNSIKYDIDRSTPFDKVKHNVKDSCCKVNKHFKKRFIETKEKLETFDDAIETTGSKYKEHFIFDHLKTRLPHYCALWVIGILLSFIACYAFGWETASTEINQSFARTVFSLFTLTVTLAIPTCLRSIFATYEDYYSTKIKEILVDRFPITLLILSAFTSIILGLGYLSGVLTVYLPIPTTFAVALLAFWTIVCVAYMFLAIEKLIHFTANAPHAVLDHLEGAIDAHIEMKTQKEYYEFRDELAALNDIAATIVKRSTGRDAAVVRCIKFTRKVHGELLDSAYIAKKFGNKEAAKLRLKGCRAARRELVRIYREAAAGKNEHACKTVVKTYCLMIADAAKAGAPWAYLTEMLSLLERIQSYALNSGVEDIESYACVEWAFVLIRLLDDAGDEINSSLLYARLGIARELVAALRRATIADAEDVLLRFVRIASNSELDVPLDDLRIEWLAVIDRAVLEYMSWAMRSAPYEIDRWLRYFADYSAPTNSKSRSIFVDSEERFAAMHQLGSTDLESEAKKRGKVSEDDDHRVYDLSPISVGVLPGMSRSKALAYIIEASWVGVPIEELASKYSSLDEALDRYAVMSDEDKEWDIATQLFATQIDLDPSRPHRKHNAADMGTSSENTSNDTSESKAQLENKNIDADDNSTVNDAIEADEKADYIDKNKENSDDSIKNNETDTQKAKSVEKETPQTNETIESIEKTISYNETNNVVRKYRPTNMPDLTAAMQAINDNNRQKAATSFINDRTNNTESQAINNNENKSYEKGNTSVLPIDEDKRIAMAYKDTSEIKKVEKQKHWKANRKENE